MLNIVWSYFRELKYLYTDQVESLEDEVAQLRQALAEKEEQERAMLKVALGQKAL